MQVRRRCTMEWPASTQCLMSSFSEPYATTALQASARFFKDVVKAKRMIVNPLAAKAPAVSGRWPLVWSPLAPCMSTIPTSLVGTAPLSTTSGRAHFPGSVSNAMCALIGAWPRVSLYRHVLSRTQGSGQSSLRLKGNASTGLWMRWLRTCSAGYAQGQLQRAAMLVPVAAGAWCAHDDPQPGHACFSARCRGTAKRCCGVHCCLKPERAGIFWLCAVALREAAPLYLSSAPVAPEQLSEHFVEEQAGNLARCPLDAPEQYVGA